MRNKLIFILVGAVLLVGVAAGGGWLLQYNAFVKTPLAIPADGATLLVPPGAGVTAVARQLHDEGMLSDMRMFRLMVRLHGKGGQLKAGEYYITPGTTPGQLLQQMVEGRVRQYTMTLIEGWNFRQVMRALEENPHLGHTLSGMSDNEIMTAIGQHGVHPEGRFLPDTYHFPRGLSDVEFLRRAFRAMAERLAQEWEQRAPNLPLKSPDEALILASIVEKETGQASERPLIAGVFTRRLELGMRLQTDPTVIYGIGEGFDGNLRRRDLEAEGAYNTYRIKGLPPTPIAMPGQSALHAAVHPAPGKELYFVARGDGSHYFSATYEEHEHAVKQYQLKRRNK
ncbi:MAG TPA: endolytic transglycosylase MltG [Gammaproteobacteria bacterium]